MSSDADQPIGYAAAIDSYWALGWKSILPLPAKAKKSPPSIKCHRAKYADHPVGCQNCTSYTGYGAVEPSYPDLLAWSESFRDGNLCLRLPDGVIGIDVDAYGVKTGAAALVEAVKRWGPLPKGPRSSSREGDLTSGIRLFRVPPGTTLETKINFSSLGIGDIEVIQPHHRYVVAWPSIHPEGGAYAWRDEYDAAVGIPAIAELPELPARWIEGLKVVPKSQFDGPIDFRIEQALTPGSPSATVHARLMLAIRELQTPGASRHDTCTRHVMAIARLGKSGESGTRSALETLCDVLIAARAMDKSGTAEETRHEFLRMLTNDNIARELSRPGITDWVGEMMKRLATDGLNLVSDDPEIESVPENDSTPSHGESERVEAVTNADSSGAVIVDDSAPRSRLEEIERGFWESRESLNMVYNTSLAMMASPWATLGMSAARALIHVRPHVTLPPLIGGPGSLNWFVALVALSSGGKGAAGQASKMLVSLPPEQVRGAGSGEGIIAAYGRPNDDTDPEPIQEALMFDVTESDTLNALNGRSASTTLTILRSAFSGETLGFSYAAKEKRRHLLAHTYRMTMAIGVQPLKAGWLLDDASGGTPQRFMWFPAEDARISMEERWPSGQLALPHRSEWTYPREIRIPDAARYTIRSERVKAMQGQQDALDGHALFCREKFAYALTVLDGRIEMSPEDWELSGIAADVSTYARELMIEEVKQAARRDAIERGQLRGIEMDAADIEKLEEQIKRGQKVMKWLLHKLDGAPGGIPQSDLLRAITSRERKALSEILASGNQLIRGELVDGSVLWFRA